MSDADAPAVRVEFVCPTCLRSTRRLDTDRVPRCPVCGIRMEADSDEPRDRFTLRHAAQKQKQRKPA